MSEYGSPSDVWGKSDRTYPTPTLGLGAVGSYFDKPPQTDDNHDPAFVVAYGILLDRSAYAVLWMTAQKMGWVQSEENWQAAKALSPIGAVSFYSDGTNNTNFRTPSVGTGGFKRVLGESNTPPVGDIEGGFDWQIENIVGTFNTHGSETGGIIRAATGVFGDSPVHAHIYRSTSSNYTGAASNPEINFDASRVVKAGDETTPQGFYVKTFIYTGADITKPAAAPSLQQLLTMAQMPKLLWNTDLTGNPVNQKEFSGDWSSIAVDEQGYDLWRKYDANRMCQIVEAGSYLPNTDYVLQYNDVVVWKGKSPVDGGNWGIAIPNTVSKIDLRPGVLQTPWHPEDKRQLNDACQYQYTYFKNALFYGFPTLSSTTSGTNTRLVNITLPTAMRKTVIDADVTMEKANWPNAVVNNASNKHFRLFGNSATYETNCYVSGLIVDQTLKIGDASAENWTVI